MSRSVRHSPMSMTAIARHALRSSRSRSHSGHGCGLLIEPVLEPYALQCRGLTTLCQRALSFGGRISTGIRSSVGSGCISSAGGRGIGGHCTDTGTCWTGGEAQAVSSVQSAHAIESDAVGGMSLGIDGLLSCDLGRGSGLRLPALGGDLGTELGECGDQVVARLALG